MTDTERDTYEIEEHPFAPFLPENARVLILGSFPPQRKRWSMEFYYPNRSNDFWKIIGLLFFGDERHFLIGEGRKFDEMTIRNFCTEKGIAMYDTACKVRRLKDNASDKYLEVVETSDIPSLLKTIPLCKGIVTTGEKATRTISDILECDAPAMNGSSVVRDVDGHSREVTLFRLPSTSRAYPMPLKDKAECYRSMFVRIGMLR